MKLPRRPCDITISGNFLSGNGQSFTPGKLALPRATAPAGCAHGYHAAPLRAGAPASAGISIARRPAACASVPARQNRIVLSHLLQASIRKDLRGRRAVSNQGHLGAVFNSGALLLKKERG